jgi:redox-regulated HSP33 family molecular chaperone
MVVNGKIDVHCQFCNKSQIFSPQDVGLAGKQ